MGESQHTTNDIQAAIQTIIKYYRTSESKRWGRDPSVKACIEVLSFIEKTCSQVSLNQNPEVYLNNILQSLAEANKNFSSHFDNEVSSGRSYFPTVSYDLKEFFYHLDKKTFNERFATT